MGTAIAVRTAQRTDALRDPVVLFEKGEIGSGASSRSGAILRQFYSNREVATMARDSLREFSQFETRTGRSIGFTRTGVLTLAGPKHPEACELLCENVEMLNELGIDVRRVNVGEIRDLIPGIKVGKGVIGAWERHGGFVDPVRTLDGFASLARNYGAVTRLGAWVDEILVEEGRVVGARTSQGEYEADQVVIAGGPWSGRMLEALGVDLPLRVVRPENVFVGMSACEAEPEDAHSMRGSTLSFDIEDMAEKAGEEMDGLAPRGLHPVLVDLEHEFYCRCEPATKRTRIGRTDYENDELVEDPDDLDETVSEEVKAWGREAIARRMPEYEGQPDAGALAAWYTMTPDAHPLLGPVPGIEGLFIATGFSGHGFKLAPSIGTGMAQMLLGDPVTAFDTEFFSPARFKGGEEWTGRFGL
jgi:glycine/D-amino acid oxidase-like deaminating enzyme